MKVTVERSSGGLWYVWSETPWWKFWSVETILLGSGHSKKQALADAQRNVNEGVGAKETLYIEKVES